MSRLLPGLGALRCAPLRLRPAALPLTAPLLSSRLSTTSKAERPTLSSTSVLTKESVRVLWAKQPHISSPSSSVPVSMTQRLIARAFSSSPAIRIRDHYTNQRRSGGGWTPPPPPSGLARLRARVNSWNPNHVVYAIMAANIVIFLMWQYAINSYQRFRDPALYNWMFKNFILSEFNIRAGRIWTLVTSTFSQMSTSHIFFNLMGLYFMAPAVATLLGSYYFLGLYLGGGLFAGLCSLTYQHLNSKRRGHQMSGSEGASGAIYACLAFFGTIFPQATFLIFFVVPAKAWMVVAGLFSWDFFQAVSGRQSLTDSAGHAGGIAFGVMSALYTRQKFLGSWRRSFRMR